MNISLLLFIRGRCRQTIYNRHKLGPKTLQFFLIDICPWLAPPARLHAALRHMPVNALRQVLPPAILLVTPYVFIF